MLDLNTHVSLSLSGLIQVQLKKQAQPKEIEIEIEEGGTAFFGAMLPTFNKVE